MCRNVDINNANIKYNVNKILQYILEYRNNLLANKI